MTRHALLVLGMHRSGTSALTRMINLLGAAPPRGLMKGSDDNPTGYWESRPITLFNNQLLASAGTSWNDDGGISPTWFHDPARQADRDLARRLLEEEFGDPSVLVFKDPRLCLLLPFWLQVLDDAGREVRALLPLRDPLEVIRSLQARQHQPCSWAAVAAPSRGLLLWLRYVLDSELHSRSLPRAVFFYDDLLLNWRECLDGLQREAQLPLPAPDAATSLAIDNHLSSRLRRQRATDADATSLPGLLLARRLKQRMRSATADSEVDGLRHHFNALIMAYAPLRAGAAVSSEPHDPWGERLLTLLQERLDRGAGPAASATVAAPARRRRVLFLSGVPGSPGHVYRVEHSLEALRQGGWRGDWCSLEDPELTSRINEVSLVCVFRTPWSPRLADVASICRARRIPLVADIDGLIFDRALLEQGRLAYVEQLPQAERERWCLRADDYRTTLSQADAVIVNTAPLAAAAARVNPRVHLLSNGLSPAMLGAADRQRGQAQAKLAAHEPRLGFASGTPSHKRDFAIVAEPIAQLLERHLRLRLVLVGEIDPGDYPCLRPYATRIERRPRVPLRHLPAEVSRFTINLAPLEPDNPFCEAKTAIRVTTAAAVGVVSVASPTAPLRDALVPGHSGLLAASPAEWETAIEELMLQPERRQSMAEAARRDVICRFGWPDWAEQARCVYATILAEFSTASGGIHIASP